MSTTTQPTPTDTDRKLAAMQAGLLAALLSGKRRSS